MRRLNKEKLTWENFSIQGDINELEVIISTPGYKSLDRNDIRMVLDSEGESFIVTSEADNMDEAMGLALKEIPLDKKVTYMAVAIWCGNPQFPVSEIASVNNALSEFEPEANISRGVYTDSNLGNSFKVTIIATGTATGEDISEIRRKIGCRNGLILRKKYETYIAQSRKKTIELIRRRHAYYTKLINDAKLKLPKISMIGSESIFQCME